MSLKIVVGSLNKVKVNAAKSGFNEILKDSDINFECIAYNAPSGVPDQPMGDDETLQGAKNRALFCYNKFVEDNNNNEPYFACGMEGGLTDENNVMTCYAYIVLLKKVNKKFKYGISRTASFEIPQKMANLVRNGKELGDADDEIFNKINSKQNDGTVGQLSNGLINRTQYYTPAVILAHVRFNYPDLYDDDDDKEQQNISEVNSNK